MPQTNDNYPIQRLNNSPIPLISHSNKRNRKLANANLDSSSYFKIRALLRQLRPQFIQVLQTPDFRNCKAAHELQIQLKLLMNLYKQVTTEVDPLEKSKPKCQPFPGVPGRQSRARDQYGEQPELLQPKQPSHQSAEKKTPTCFDSQKKLDDCYARKSYIVGGSAFGWNFITFGGSSPVYYGLTKEFYRNTLKSKMSGTGISSHISGPSEVI